MLEIYVQVAGDHWINPEQVKQQLDQSRSSEIILDLGAEGPSLSALGITDVLIDHCRDRCIDAKNVKIRAWSNNIEILPFARFENMPMRLSHFFWMSRNYWDDMIASDGTYRFGLFIGRKTPARCRIMRDMMSKWPGASLTSCMHGSIDLFPRSHQGINLESISDWIPDHDDFVTWWRQHAPQSIDGHSVQNQYRKSLNTNRDLLSCCYKTFDIELVCETYTIGKTFFPTEKTVRPLMAGKPLLVYGPRLYLHRLRDLGFRTWNDMWSEDYDFDEGPLRWTAMQDTIQQIQDLEWGKYQEAIGEIAKHNRSRLEQLISEYAPS